MARLKRKMGFETHSPSFITREGNEINHEAGKWAELVLVKYGERSNLNDLKKKLLKKVAFKVCDSFQNIWPYFLYLMIFLI